MPSFAPLGLHRRAGFQPKAYALGYVLSALRAFALPYRLTQGRPRLIKGKPLAALRGDRKGQHSIRINDQWRVCFVWRAGHAWEVEIVDYH